MKNIEIENNKIVVITGQKERAEDALREIISIVDNQKEKDRNVVY